VWYRRPALQSILYLEEDIVVANTVHHITSSLWERALAAQQADGQTQARQTDAGQAPVGPRFMGLMLMYRDNLWTVTGALSRAAWQHMWEHMGMCV